eukprot:m.1106773 g.1106773  ORF g.1106773 m.1106773 type:complete len:164 (-) comp24345_c0_seq20:4511-5002(-)
MCCCAGTHCVAYCILLGADFMWAHVLWGRAFAIVYVYPVELFPTSARSGAIGLSSMCSRMGGILAPQMILLQQFGKAVSTRPLGGPYRCVVVTVCTLLCEASEIVRSSRIFVPWEHGGMYGPLQLGCCVGQSMYSAVLVNVSALSLQSIQLCLLCVTCWLRVG